eukprot:jgi/Undpi1/10786/HiC_scaffold_29.g13234.m1
MMPRTDQRYPHQQHQHQQQQQQQQQQHQQHQQHGRDGYDEDWDDDVYYAAASRPGSNGSQKASGRDKQSGGGAGGRDERERDDKAGDEAAKEGRDGRERTPTKRHYMKVPNMRHPRAMRPSGENAFPTGILHPADLLSSPRASTDTDLGDTPTSSSGNGSSVALLGNLTPPSPLDQEPGGREGPLEPEVRVSERPGSGALASNTSVSLIQTASTTPQWASRLDDTISRARTTPQRPYNSEDLVRLVVRYPTRGNLDLFPAQKKARVRSPLGASPPGASPGADRTAVFSAIGGRGDMTTQSSPAAAAAVATGGGGGGVASSKRKRAATGAGPSQRLGAVAWPALRGVASPTPRSCRQDPVQGAPAGSSKVRGEHGAATAAASGHGGADNNRRPHHAGQQQQQQQQRRRLRGEPKLSLGSSFSCSTRPAGRDTNPSSGRPCVSSLRDEAVASRQDSGNGAEMKRPSLTDRPARWAGKGGSVAARSPLRPPGAAIAPRGSDNNVKGLQHTTGARHPSTTSKAPPGSRLLARAGARGGGQESEARTIKLTSVFKASAASSPRACGAWGKDSHPEGHRGSSHHHPRHRPGLPGATPEASFDPTQMGPASATRGVKAEEVEEVGSDEDDLMDDDSADVADWSTRNGSLLRGNYQGDGEGTEDSVCEYDDRALGGGVDEGGTSNENGADNQLRRDSLSDVSAVGRLQGGGGVVAATAPETPRSERKGQQLPRHQQHQQQQHQQQRQQQRQQHHQQRQQQHQQQQQQQHQQQKRAQQPESEDPGPPPRTPVRPRTISSSSFERQTPHAPSATSSSARPGDWRPSFGSGGEGKVGRSPGTMQAPWAAFSTPLRDGGAGWVPPSGSSATGSASVRRKRGGGAGNGPLGRLLQQVRARFDGDEARLLSGEFPFRHAPKSANPEGKPLHSGGASGRDHGDPRTRCSVALDVSVMPSVPGQGTASDGAGGGAGEQERGGEGVVDVHAAVRTVPRRFAAAADA